MRRSRLASSRSCPTRNRAVALPKAGASGVSLLRARRSNRPPLPAQRAGFKPADTQTLFLSTIRDDVAPPLLATIALGMKVGK
jgi:hypothetical protein